MKKLLFISIISLLTIACEDDELEFYCISGVDQNGNRVQLNCAVKERINATIEKYPEYTDYQSQRVASCGACI